jgi:hypothetical protein
LPDHGGGGRGHCDPAAGARDSPGDVLVADIDHVRLPGGVEMGKMPSGFAIAAAHRRRFGRRIAGSGSVA